MMQELNYIRCGDYYIPDIRLPEENRPTIMRCSSLTSRTPETKAIVLPMKQS